VCGASASVRYPSTERLSLVGDGQSFSAFAAAGGQHFSTVGGGHSLAETVLVGSFSQRGLECSLHNILCCFCYRSGGLEPLFPLNLEVQKYTKKSIYRQKNHPFFYFPDLKCCLLTNKG
jgi:hypothetical protein